MGICRFCGQEIMGADVPEMECTCDKAKRWKYREELKSKAAEKIENLFGESGKEGRTMYGDVAIPEENRKLLNDVVPYLMDGHIKSVTIAVPNICTCSMRMAGFEIKIGRKQSKAVQETVR